MHGDTILNSQQFCKYFIKSLHRECSGNEVTTRRSGMDPPRKNDIFLNLS